MRASSRALVVAVLTTVTAVTPVLPQLPLRPLEVGTTSLALAFAAEEDGSWVSAPVEGDTTIAGLTWEDATDRPDRAQVRVRVDGDWTAWEDVEVDDEHSPDPGSAEAAVERGGTAPIVVEGADAIQFRVEGEQSPEDIVAELVDVDDPDAGRRGRTPAASAEAVPSRPAIHTRDEWGGDSCVKRDPDDIDYADEVEVLFVHHTTGHTSYSQSEVASIVRGICSYHVNGRGWDDIGYNALIDRYGGIWEGRAGGIDRGVIGAHTGGFNSYSTGVAFIGDHQSGGAPTVAAQDALARYAAWKLDVHNVDPTGTAVLTSNGSSRWADGTAVTFETVSGHRDASATSCPGSSCYVLLPNFRAAIDALGGFRIFGGWADKHLYELTRDGWGDPVFTFSFSHEARWTFELRDDLGDLVLRTSGRGTSGRVVWDTDAGGRIAPKGEYTSTVRATRVSNGAAASPSDHLVVLGGPLGDFDDVPETNVFHDDIAWLARRGITRGCNPPENTSFCPGAVVTRAQMAAFLTRALSLPAPDEPIRFDDVPATSVFAGDISRLAGAGITRGCGGDGTLFCPDDPVTREQMAAFLARAFELANASHPGFTDVSVLNRYHNDIRRLAAAGITQGCNPPDNTMFCPTKPVTRQQMAAFLHRAMT